MKIPYTNETERFVHVGGVMIPPGDTREIDARLHPDYKAPAPIDDEPAVSELAMMLAGTVATITAGFGALADEELTELRALEAAAVPKPRASLLKAIDEELLERASKAADGGEGGETGAGEGAGTGAGGGAG